MNRAILFGRLTKDAETRYSQGEEQMAISRFTLAVDRIGSKEQTADFISCVAFGKTAQFFEKYGKKGSKFLVEGRIQTGAYTNKEGSKVYTTDVVVEKAEFGESKASQDNAMSNINFPVETESFTSVPEGFDELPFGKL